MASNTVCSGRTAPPNIAPIPDNLDVNSAFLASLGRPVECIAPAQAHGLYKAGFGAAQTSGITCLLFLAKCDQKCHIWPEVIERWQPRS